MNMHIVIINEIKILKSLSFTKIFHVDEVEITLVTMIKFYEEQYILLLWVEIVE